MDVPTPTTDGDDERIADLLPAWEALFERGEDVSAADLSADRPDLVLALAARIDLLKAVSWVRDDPTAPPAVGLPAPPGEPLAGRYRFDALIGEGGFGLVWQGYDLQLDRKVAVKVPRPGRTNRGVDGENTLLAEARKVAGLAHPGIVPVFDVGRHGSVTFLVPELIDGDDLGRRMKAGPIPVREGVRIVAEAARHLDFAHRKGFVHRDVKPANILVGRDGRVYVSDFGTAASAEVAWVSDGGIGTAPYMAPERLGGSADDEVRGDVYGLGVVLYELLTGRLLFDVGGRGGQRAAFLGHEPAPLRSLNSSVLEAVDWVCLRCLAKDPADRQGHRRCRRQRLGDMVGRGRPAGQGYDRTHSDLAWRVVTGVLFSDGGDNGRANDGRNVGGKANRPEAPAGAVDRHRQRRAGRHEWSFHLFPTRGRGPTPGNGCKSTVIS